MVLLLMWPGRALSLIYVGAVGGHPSDDILGGQYRANFHHPEAQVSLSRQSVVLKVHRPPPCIFRGVIPEIDVWRAANLVLRRRGERAIEESSCALPRLALAP
jgi:hypothetical protein